MELYKNGLPTNDFTFHKYPAGECYFKGEPKLNTVYTAVSRGVHMEDMLKLSLLEEIFENYHSQLRLVLPYLPGARDDKGYRGAEKYVRLIGQVSMCAIHTFDPHSGFMLNKFRYGNSHDSVSAVQAAFDRQTLAGIIAPDKGASQRAKAVAKAMDLPCFHAEKTRDQATGKLSGFTCQPLPDTGRLLVVDDICDGGGTFMGLAEVTGLPPERLALWVSHGIFSGNAIWLRDHYGEIATTDSFPSLTQVAHTIIPVLDHMPGVLT